MLCKSALCVISCVLSLCSGVAMAAGPPLELEAKIPLGAIKGRIDHFAVDLERQRLFVAELGNDSVGVIDLKARQVIRTIAGLSAPQGLGYVRFTDTLYVANAGDGSVRLFKGIDLVPDGQIAFGDDADNIRVDTRNNRVYVGYGEGALSIIDPMTRAKVEDVPLQGHPESFQIDAEGGRIFVNVPDAKQIAVIDIAASKQTTAWSTGNYRANFPMAFDSKTAHVIVGFRKPARLMAFDSHNGKTVADIDLCGDTDDIFVDAVRRRIYVACGQGAVDVIEQRDTSYTRVGRVPIPAGARTAFFVPELDRLFVAVRATAHDPAAVWVFRPTS